MENVDVAVLRALQIWRAQRQHALLATVVRTWGSSPRPTGSIMALSETGSVVGSVSGGCIEDDLIYRYQSTHLAGSVKHQIPAGKTERVIYGVSADEAHRFGLPCGGTLEIVLEFNPDPDLLLTLINELVRGNMVQRRIELATGHVTLHSVQKPTSLTDDGSYLQNTFGPEYRMLLIGAGQLAECLASMAISCGFAVTVCDPREEYLNGFSLIGGSILQDMPDDAVRGFQADHRSCVIALTHDPKLDDLALLEALNTDAFYVGAIGSRRNNEARRSRLINHFEQTHASLAHLRGPIGIYIGSKTPPEIAVSVMAEVLAVKNGVALTREMAVGGAKDISDLDQRSSSYVSQNQP